MAGKMNTDADRARRAMYGSMRGRDLYWGITLGIFSNLFTLYLISQGSDLPQLAISAAVVGTFIFVMVNSFDCMDDQEAATNFGKKFLEAPWTMFKGLVFLIFGAMAVTQLMEIW